MRGVNLTTVGAWRLFPDESKKELADLVFDVSTQMGRLAASFKLSFVQKVDVLWLVTVFPSNSVSNSSEQP